MSYDDSDSYSGEERKQSIPLVAREEGGRAAAEGEVVMNAAAFQAFLTACTAGGSDAWIHARLAGIKAAKQSDELVLVSHSVNLMGIEMDYSVNEEERKVTVRCEVRTRERVGAEICALVGCSTALMTLLTSLRPFDKGMTIQGLRIL